VTGVHDGTVVPVRVCSSLSGPRFQSVQEEADLGIPTFLRSIEASSLSMWMRESQSLWAFPAVILLHTLGLVLIAGPSVVMDLRILGVAPQLPISPLERLHKMMWGGFFLNLFSGVILLIAYPTKALTDPVFYLKMSCVAGAVVCMQMIHNRLFRLSAGQANTMALRSRNLAKVSLACWFGAIVAGKFIEYTYRYIVYPG
jgi:hypothetical protein